MIQLSLLGGFELSASDRDIELAPGAQRLLGFLALRRRPLPRSLVAGTLWPDGSDSRAAANLRSVLWRLHRSDLPLVHTDRGRVQLATGVGVDLYDATALAHRIVEGRASPGEELRWRALGSDVLPDWYDDWLTDEREHFHQLRLHALEAVATHLAARCDFSEALDAALAAVAAEPLRESAHRAVIGVHLAEGNAAQAILQYRRCERLFASELGIPPPPEMRATIDRAMRSRALA